MKLATWLIRGAMSLLVCSVLVALATEGQELDLERIFHRMSRFFLFAGLAAMLGSAAYAWARLGRKGVSL